MGCSASTNTSQATKLKQIQIITESGKIFILAYDRYLRISQIKSYMEMRIAQNSTNIHLFLKIEQSSQQIQSSNKINNKSTVVQKDDDKLKQQQKQQTEQVNRQQNQDQQQQSDQNEKVTKEAEENEIIIKEGDKIYQQIELKDNEMLHNYAKMLHKNACIYLAQSSKPCNSPQNNKQNESVSTQDDNLGRIKNINIGYYVKNECVIYQGVIDKLEKGEQITQSQIDLVQKGVSQNNNNNNDNKLEQPQFQQSSISNNQQQQQLQQQPLSSNDNIQVDFNQSPQKINSNHSIQIEAN